MTQLSVSNRIVFGFATITIILIGLGFYALFQVGEVRNTVDMIVERDMSAMQKLDRIDQAQRDMTEARSSAMKQMLLRAAGKRASPDEAMARWQAQNNATTQALSDLRNTTANYQDNAVTGSRSEQWKSLVTLAAEIDQALARTHADVDRQFAAIRSNDVDGAIAQEERLTADRDVLTDKITAMRNVLADAVQTGRSAAEDVYVESRTSILIALVLASALSIAVALGIRRSIMGPLSEFMSFVSRVGQGDLGGQTAATGPDELGQLGGTLNSMVDGLRTLASQSREATENLNAAATEIRASTQEQAASVEEQLAAVQETAATVDEITHAGGQINRRAQEVITAAQATAQTSNAGIAAVEDTVRSMDLIREQAEAVAENIVALSERTQAISDIIATVNDVSERSHLLALNASLEAAAAGENGRSFAIVAAEMKTLADQAKDATRQVRSILGEIQRGINSSVMLTEEAVKRVTTGKQRTDTTQSTIEEMSTRIQESIQTFQQIVASTNQQQIGIEQVTIALQNIRQASQQTAASTRQLDQAAANLTELSGQLLRLAERYRL